MTYDALHPGREWLDTDGAPIQAHGGSIIAVDGTFYWYGENKEKTEPGNGIWHWGVRCYSSTDLYNWQDRGLVIEPDLADASSPLHPAQQVDRPHIVFNPATGKYVCWIKIMHRDQTQASTVLVADDILGPYAIVTTGLKPLGMDAGDFDLVVDADTGRGYYIFERVHSELIVAELTADFTDVSGAYTTHFPHPHPPLVREAPAHFLRNGRHYLFTSGTTGYFPNASEVAVADDLHGPWTVLGDPHPDDATRTSYSSQICSVFRHPGKRDLFIALADRWAPDFDTARAAEVAGYFADYFTAPPTLDPIPFPDGIVEPNTSRARYVWLPVRFEGEMAYLDWRDEWRIEEFD